MSTLESRQRRYDEWRMQASAMHCVSRFSQKRGHWIWKRTVRENAMRSLVAFPWYWMRFMHKIGEIFTEAQVLICQAPSMRSINNSSSSSSRECNPINNINGNRIQQPGAVIHETTKLRNDQKIHQPHACGIFSYIHYSVFRQPKLCLSVPGAVTLTTFY
mmetsp:Transcript_14479/g.33706  ORF Transcript_14479/g.33706 Transcript_14479/m.33706 type:complete len:160 (+) Transcript_14479:977-1456(+)